MESARKSQLLTMSLTDELIPVEERIIFQLGDEAGDRGPNVRQPRQHILSRSLKHFLLSVRRRRLCGVVGRGTRRRRRPCVRWSVHDPYCRGLRLSQKSSLIQLLRFRHKLFLWVSVVLVKLFSQGSQMMQAIGNDFLRRISIPSSLHIAQGVSIDVAIKSVFYLFCMKLIQLTIRETTRQVKLCSCQV